MQVKIYHNPRCSKSRQMLALLQERDLDIEIVEYLNTPPSVDELTRLHKMLDVPLREMMRPGESDYKALGLGDKSVDDARLLRALAEHPILLQRPLVVVDGKAAIGRPPENVLAILPELT